MLFLSTHILDCAKILTYSYLVIPLPQDTPHPQPPTMVDIPVDDRDPLKAIDIQGVSGGHRNVVDKAKAHGRRPLSVVTRRPDEGVGVAHLTGVMQVQAQDGSGVQGQDLTGAPKRKCSRNNCRNHGP